MIEFAMSVRQPFAELILEEEKKFEYRSRPTKVRGVVYLYAAKRPFDSEKVWADSGLQFEELASGLVVGKFELTDCTWNAKKGCFQYHLKNPYRLKRPFKPTGMPQPGFFRVRK